EEPLGPLFLEDVGAGARRHRRRDRDEVRVFGGELRQRIAEYFGPLRWPGVDGLQPTGDGIVWRAGVILLEIGLGQREAFSLLGDDVDHARALERLHDVERMQ